MRHFPNRQKPSHARSQTSSAGEVSTRAAISLSSKTATIPCTASFDCRSLSGRILSLNYEKNEEARAHYRHYRPGRLVLGRVSNLTQLRRMGHHTANEPSSSDEPQNNPPLAAPAHALGQFTRYPSDYSCTQGSSTGRDIQSCGTIRRRYLIQMSRRNMGGELCRRKTAHSRSDAHMSEGPNIPRINKRDVR